ncbi:MAG: hypothetical protein U0X93_11850 [Anaerolineales bacterium]
MVTYPSTIEGFGNAFLEAVYYRRLILVNNYSIYEVDIKPKGFRTIWFDGFISDSPLDATRNALKHPRPDAGMDGVEQIINSPNDILVHCSRASVRVHRGRLFGVSGVIRFRAAKFTLRYEKFHSLCVLCYKS